MISFDDALEILRKEGAAQNVIEHCIEVSKVSVEIAEILQSRGDKVDIELVRVGGLLHDLGRARIHDISHAHEGTLMAKELGLDERLVKIIRNHIGAGLTKEDAKELGLPEEDFIPRSIEEKIVAHADNLVKGTRKIGIDKRASIMKKKGASPESIKRVLSLADELGIAKL
ncbi:uncharacterized protein J2755_002159 [Methanohalophilus levihalophilus]|uniref:HDIG domain-containing metalloprotein n=1 Tax=Methanohalophilus levihalophilus TaxID=1431282 RepID=UPI001AE99EF2|nr:HDIG domain-containing metalloprotein [Methanohalophilus levihalophilus]MBP2031196.1 uncharacterized protein [Methanohalophilus levihalophilus]